MILPYSELLGVGYYNTLDQVKDYGCNNCENEVVFHKIYKQMDRM